MPAPQLLRLPRRIFRKLAIEPCPTATALVARFPILSDLAEQEGIDIRERINVDVHQ